MYAIDTELFDDNARKVGDFPTHWAACEEMIRLAKVREARAAELSGNSGTLEKPE